MGKGNKAYRLTHEEAALVASLRGAGVKPAEVVRQLAADCVTNLPHDHYTRIIAIRLVNAWNDNLGVEGNE